MPVPINPKTVRYKIAQFFLRALYGRKYHYISPWKHGSVATTVVLVKDGKALLGKRRGNIEYIGLWANPGGHVDLGTGETLAETGAREVLEEMNIHIDASKLTHDRMIDVHLDHHAEYMELLDTGHICLTYVYEVTDEELATMQESDEAHEFTWFTKGDLQEHLKKPDLHFIENRQFYCALKAIELTA